MSKLLVTRGIPASGKSTFAKEWVAKDATNRARVSRDDFRKMLRGNAHPWTGDSDFEKSVTILMNESIKHFLSKGREVVVDATNLHAKFAKQFFNMATEVEFVDFPISQAEAIVRDAKRPAGDRVGAHVIVDFVKRFNADGKLPKPPERQVEAIQNPDPYVPHYGPDTFACDIDGTLAHVVENGRSHYDYSRVSEDAVDPHVAEMVRDLATLGYDIVLISGREDRCRVDTEDWLRDNDIPFNALFMRATGDHRADDIVKLEIFNEHIRNNYNVQGVFDDRDRVVKMWRSLGLKCYQVNYGDF